MEVFKRDIKSIIQELKSLEEEIITCQTPTKLVPLLYSYYSFINIYNIYSYKKYDKEIKLDKYLLNECQEIIKNLSNSRKEEFIKTKSSHTNFSLEIIDNMLDCLNEVKHLRSSWIGKNNFYQIFNQINEQEDNEQRIFYMKQINPKTFGSTILNFQNNKSYILLSTPYKYELNSLFTIYHELGHVKDFENISINKSSFDMYTYQMKSFYVEVLSMKKEKEAIEYLIKHDIKKDIATSYLNKYYLDIFSFLNQMLILSLFDDNKIDNDMYLGYTKKDIKNFLDQIGIVNKNNLFLDKFDLDDEVIYSYGGVLAIYLSYLEKNDYQRYKENLSNFLNLQTEQFSPNHLEKLGTNINELGKIVKHEMMEFRPKSYKK